MGEVIVGVSVKFREKTAIQLQECFTKYGCNIKTRLGLHDVDKNACSPSGLIILQLFEADQVLNEMLDAFNSIDGVSAKSISFE